MKTIIVEDNISSADGLVNALKTVPFIQYLGAAHTISQAKALIIDCEPELLLMDIEIEADCTTTFDLLQELIIENKLRFEIIFTTAYPSSDYTLRAIKLSCLDFLPKPVSYEDLLIALNKVYRNREAWSILEQQVQLAHSLYEKPQDVQSAIYVPALNHELVKINLNHILYIESNGSGKLTTLFFINDQKPLNCNHAIGFFRETLTAELGFFMIHQSRIINLQHMSSFNPTDNIVSMESAKGRISLNASRRHGKQFKDYLQNVSPKKLLEENLSLLQKLWRMMKGY